MQKIKYCKLIIILTAFMILNWAITIYMPYSGIKNVHMDDMITPILLNSGSYESLLNIVILVLPYSIAFNYLLFNLQTYNIIRFKSKSHLFKYIITNIIVFSAVFVFIKTLVSIVLTTMLFGVNELIALSFYKINFINMFLQILFYVKVGLLLVITTHILGRRTSILLIILECLFQYALLTFNILKWMPIKDSTKFSMCISGRPYENFYFSSLARAVIIVLFIAFFSMNVIRNGDYLKNEKN